MAIYCNFPEQPNIKVECDAQYLEKKLTAIRAFQSQKQIEQIVSNVRDAGPLEYFRDINFDLYSPENYQHLF